MTQRFAIPGRLMGLNEYTRQCRANKYAGNKAKRDDQMRIACAINAARLKPAKGPVYIRYLWVEPDRRRDRDNIAFAQKFVQDALAARGIIRGDGWDGVAGFAHEFAVDKSNPRIEVEIIERVTQSE